MKDCNCHPCAIGYANLLLPSGDLTSTPERICWKLQCLSTSKYYIRATWTQIFWTQIFWTPIFCGSENEIGRKCILQAENIMPGSKKLWEEHLFPSEKIVFLPSVEKTTIFSSGNKSSPQSFSVPGIMFPPRRNIYLCTVLNGSLCRFLYTKKILKKKFYILTYIWPTLFSFIAFWSRVQ